MQELLDRKKLETIGELDDIFSYINAAIAAQQ
jgi:hypothetical protein